MAYIARAGRPENRGDGGTADFLQDCIEVEQGHLGAAGDIVRLVDGSGVVGEQSQEIGLDGIVHIGEIAALEAVAVDERGLSLADAQHQPGDDSGIGAVGALARAKNIEVTQADELEAVQAAEYSRVELVDGLADGIRRKWLAGAVFALGQVRLVAIDRRRGGIYDALYPGADSGPEHIEGTIGIGGVGGQGVGDRAGYRAQGRLVANAVDTLTSLQHRCIIADIPFDELKAGMAEQMGQVPAAPRGEVVEYPHQLHPGVCDQGICYMRADESGAAGEEDMHKRIRTSH